MLLLKRISISKKLWLLVILSIIATLWLLIFSANLLKSRINDATDQALKGHLDQAHSLVTFYQGQAAQLGEEQAKSQALAALTQLRFEGKHYFWVLDTDGKLLAHPHKTETLGQDITRETDVEGSPFWLEMVNLGRGPGQGFLTYHLKGADGQPVEKTAYVVRDNQWNWIIGAGIEHASGQALFWDLVIRLIWVSLIATAVTQLVSHFVRRDIATAIHELEVACDAMADGDLSDKDSHLHDRKDELGHLAQALGKMRQSLVTVLSQVKRTATDAQEQALALADSAQASRHSIIEQQSQLQQVATAVNEMSHTIGDVANNAEQTATTTHAASASSEQGQQRMHQAEARINDLAASVGASADRIRELHQGVQAISEITDVINGISEQTNLLALNAAIEAARAGEQGRGFAVVADEVRGLAARTRESTSQVQSTIETLQNGAMVSVEAMGSCTTLASDSAAESKAMALELEQVVSRIRDANDRAGQIATASEQQSAVAEEINQNLIRANESGSEVELQAQQVAGQSQALLDHAASLQNQLQRFNFSG
ncbi:methyl-accepting chemotaxis protein [Ferrimonas sp. YFM]|uniref:methyl-accepting chemotaxis protein n=1 Tax=Ferrimonas sp. YFM TaxID=3028878 RepID=UPI002573B496|nr:methyl-accepting chemotaxis protein [Ferrimonas sp. YFM]BDY06832.1 methyl-accepting chemotaxis protein [Ferrimonas sp. YFM]